MAILWLVLETKLLFFWLWLWQLKEYHFGRFKAHFETQKIRKFLFSFIGPRYPKLTNKILVILGSGIIIEFLILSRLFSLLDNLFYLWLLILIILAPALFSLLVLFFQFPVGILTKTIMRKAQRKREETKDLIVIGITGSYGKTSTKEILATILSEKFRVLKTKEHTNAEIGIAKTILRDLKPEHQIFIAEIGAYERGKIKQVCKMLRPKIGILTGINEQHMSTFGSQENIIKAKYELIESLPEDGTAFFNAKNQYCRELFKRTNIKKILYGNESATFENQNIEAAIAVAKELGMTDEEILEAEKGIDEKFLKLQVKKGRNEINFIDSTYSANPDGVIAHLDYLKTLSGRKVIVMPCLIELGPASSGIHRKIGRKIAEICDLAIIVTKDYFREIESGAIEAGMPPNNILLIENPKKIIEKIKNYCGTGDTVLLEGRIPREVIEQLVAGS